MRRFAWFLFGAVALLGAIAIAGGLVRMGSHGFSAREQPGVLEPWIARQARSMAVPSSAKAQTNSSANSPEVLAEVRAHWADHCATCHANNGGGNTEMGKHMYPPAPDMREADTQNMTDGELFYIIQNGIRLTGMPAWGSGSDHESEDSWKLVRFIRHLPKLTSEEEAEMKELNPKRKGDKSHTPYGGHRRHQHDGADSDRQPPRNHNGVCRT